MSREAVALVDAELFRLGDDVLAAERTAELGHEVGRQRHAASVRSLGRRYCPAWPGSTEAAGGDCPQRSPEPGSSAWRWSSPGRFWVAAI